MAKAKKLSTTSKRFSCTWQGCNWTFGRNFDLLRHRTTVHLRLKPLCLVPGCTARPLRADKLREHSRIHRPHLNGRYSNNATQIFRTSASPDTTRAFEPATSTTITHLSVESAMFDPGEKSITELDDSSLADDTAGTDGYTCLADVIHTTHTYGAPLDSYTSEVDISLEFNNSLFQPNPDNAGSLSRWIEDNFGDDNIMNWHVPTHLS